MGDLKFFEIKKDMVLGLDIETSIRSYWRQLIWFWYQHLQNDEFKFIQLTD